VLTWPHNRFRRDVAEHSVSLLSDCLLTHWSLDLGTVVGVGMTALAVWRETDHD
jgi:hypothetical protein